MRIILVMVMLIASVYAKGIFSNTQQVEASAYMGALKDLIVATQKTRGTTFGYHNGNTTALLLIYQYRKDMNRAIKVMNALPLAKDSSISSRATTIEQALKQLNKKALKLPAQKVFNAYTLNIERSLALAKVINEKSFSDLSPFVQDAADVMLESILPLSEKIGQLRALGTGVAAQGKMNAPQKQKIETLIKNIDALNEKFQKSENKLLMSYKTKLPKQTREQMQKIQMVLNQYLSYTQDIILQKEIKVKASEYFVRATKVISEIMVVFNLNNEAIVNDSKGWL